MRKKSISLAQAYRMQKSPNKKTARAAKAVIKNGKKRKTNPSY